MKTLKIAWLAVLLALSACANLTTRYTKPAGEIGARPIYVVATVGMIADIVRNVGGERVQVIGLMGPGVDPHLYKPSAGDALKLGNADVIFYGGLHLEGRMVDLFEKIEHSGKSAVAVTRDIPENLLHAAEGGDELGHDPHVWFDVTLWQYAVKTVAAELSRIDPAGAARFRQNEARYLAELNTLNTYAIAEMQKIPPDSRVMITAHDAFGYFGARYGLEVRGLQGMSTASEISAADVQDLSDFIAQRKIKAIFVESAVPESTVRAVQEAVRSRGWDVAIGGELFADALGADGTPEGTYIGMVKHNVDTIVSALR
jgi:manganese/zinc/iron transport system substrate-binding protein